MAASGEGDFSELLLELIQGQLLRLWTATPGRVVAYNAADQTVDVQPIPYEWDGAGGQESLPVLPGVPVQFPRGKGFALTWPLAAGDHVLLVFCRRSLERWRATGVDGDPQSDRHHDISDAVALPGAFPAGDKLTSVPSGDVELREPTGGFIKLGQGAASFAARKGDATSTSVPSDWSTFATQVAGYINGLVPGTVTIPAPGAWSGTISGGSAVVKVK